MNYLVVKWVLRKTLSEHFALYDHKISCPKFKSVGFNTVLICDCLFSLVIWCSLLLRVLIFSYQLMVNSTLYKIEHKHSITLDSPEFEYINFPKKPTLLSEPINLFLSKNSSNPISNTSEVHGVHTTNHIQTISRKLIFHIH
jgi:hypothetical protein